MALDGIFKRAQPQKKFWHRPTSKKSENLRGLASSNQSLSIGHNTEENMHVRLSLIVKISHDYSTISTISTVRFIVIIIMPILSTVTWNMFSMSYFISLNVGLLLASHCQHSRIKLRFEMYWIKTLKGDYR